MKRRRLWWGCVHAALILALAGLAQAQEQDLKLDNYVGKLPDKQFLELPGVHDPLARLLGERLRAFLDRFQVVRPIDQVSRDIVAEGCVRSHCAAEQAAFAIDLDTRAAAAASLTQGRYMDIYSKSTTNYNRLPPGLRHWISSRTSQITDFKRLKFRFHK